MREKFPEQSEHGYKTRKGKTTHFVIHTPHLVDYDEGVDMPRMIELDGYLTINVLPDGRPGEVFVRMGKHGSSLAWVDEWCTQHSLLLQGGENAAGERWTVDTLCRKFAFKSYWPFGGVTGCEADGINMCSSITDLICKVLLSRFGKKQEV